MEQHSIFLLSIFLVTQLFLAGVLAAPGQTYIANSEHDIIVIDSFEEPASLSFRRATSGFKAVIAEQTMVAVIVTTIETTIVDTIAVPDILDGRAMTINPATSLQHVGSTSSLLQIINTDSAMVTSATNMVLGSWSSPTSTFDDAICDDIFCNTDGNRICIYWGGMTSWDVSLGPIPGEQPTIIGTC